MAEEIRRIEIDGLTLIWGNRTRNKAKLREESLARHLALPPEERLRVALSLLRPARAAER